MAFGKKSARRVLRRDSAFLRQFVLRAAFCAFFTICRPPPVWPPSDGIPSPFFRFVNPQPARAVPPARRLRPVSPVPPAHRAAFWAVAQSARLSVCVRNKKGAARSSAGRSARREAARLPLPKRRIFVWLHEDSRRYALRGALPSFGSFRLRSANITVNATPAAIQDAI